jgi:HD-like signal output (HDOD) protein
VTAALWRGVPNRTAPFVRNWWRHSVAAAFIARHNGGDLPMDSAYTAALLHGVGQLALFEDAPQDYPKLVDEAYAEGTDLLLAERGMFGVDHAELAGVLLESWSLPEQLCDAVATHHDASIATDLVVAVQTGCAVAEQAGFGRCGCHRGVREGVSGPPVELLGGYVLDTLVAEINQIECSLG